MEYQEPILVVDDNERVAQSLAMVLRHSGYMVVTASSAEQALELASGMAVELAAVDVQLPRMDGLRAAVELCKRLPNCKILLISGDAGMSEVLEHARKEGRKEGRKELIFPSWRSRSRQNSYSPPSVLCLPTSRTGSISEGSGRLAVIPQPEDRRELLAVIELVQSSVTVDRLPPLRGRDGRS